LASTIILCALRKLKIGNNVYIDPRSKVLCNGWIDIQDEVLIGPNYFIVSGNYVNHNRSFRLNKTVARL